MSCNKLHPLAAQQAIVPLFPSKLAAVMEFEIQITFSAFHILYGEA